MILHITRAQYVADHRVHVWFSDGTNGEIDLTAVLEGPVFEPLRDKNYFQHFRLEGHTLTWENGADFAPEYLQGLIHAQSPA